MQEMSLDYHFTVEQEVGSFAHSFFGFNGKLDCKLIILSLQTTASSRVKLFGGGEKVPAGWGCRDRWGMEDRGTERSRGLERPDDRGGHGFGHPSQS